MPLRDLFYIAKLYEKMIQKEKKDLYSGNRIRIPTPRFVVFYNGTDEQPERKILRLSESFYRQEERVKNKLFHNANYVRIASIVRARPNLCDA